MDSISSRARLESFMVPIGEIGRGFFFQHRLGQAALLDEGFAQAYDPARIADRSTYEEPHQYATGVSTVVVNGEVVVDGGDHTSALPGRVLRRQAAA
jgi:N-acyl-D-aspartate/D-glutamate deacylase